MKSNSLHETTANDLIAGAVATAWRTTAWRWVTAGLAVLCLSLPLSVQAQETQPDSTLNPAGSLTQAVPVNSVNPGISAERLQALLEQNRSQDVPQGPFSAPIVGTEQRSHKILILKAGMDWNTPEALVWEWDASQSPEIQPEHRRWFNTPDECKPVLGATHLLMTASGGGVALVRLQDKKTLFYALAGGNPHSAELLPDGNVVSISSAGYFTVYVVPETFTTPNVPKKQFPIPGGHGLVWDAQEKRLWALGSLVLVAYRYNFDKAHPDFTKEFSIPVKDTPGEGGHDLCWVPGSRALFCTGKGVGVFDLETRQFTSIRDPNGTSSHRRSTQCIKSVSLSPEGVLIYQVPSEEWWSDQIHFGNQPLTPAGTLKNAKFYKARWWMPQ